MHHLGKINGMMVAMTDHALKNLVRMSIDAETVKEALTNPDEAWYSKKYVGDKCYRRGPVTLATCVNKRGLVIVKTALWSSAEDWFDAAEKRHPW